MVIARQEFVRENLSQPIRTPLHVDEEGRVIVPILDPDIISLYGTSQQYFVLRFAQTQKLHNSVDKAFWNAAAIHYGLGERAAGPLYKQHVGWSGTTKIQQTVREGIGAIYDVLPETLQVQFDRDALTVLRARSAPINLARGRVATQTREFRERQGELRRSEAPDHPRRQKASQVFTTLRHQPSFIAAMEYALAQPEVKLRTATSLSEAMTRAPERIEALIAYNQAPETRELRRESWNVDKMQAAKRHAARRRLPISITRYRKEVKPMRSVERIDRALWQTVSRRPDVLEAIFRYGRFTAEEIEKLSIYFHSHGEQNRPEPHILERFSQGVAYCG